MRQLNAILTLAAVGVLATAASVSARLWTSGNFTVDAEYVSTSEDGTVYLQQADGTKLAIQKDMLSEKDLEYLANLTAKEENPFKAVESNEQKSDESITSVVVGPIKEVTLTPEAGPQTGDRKILQINGVDFVFCWCPAGNFVMGSPANEYERDRDEAQHAVTLTKGFWMLETEVTQAQWNAIFAENPSRFKAANRPVDSVTWDEAVKFCRKLSEAAGVKAQLPTEAQWEYACRAGSVTPFHFGSTLNGDKAVVDGEEPYGRVPAGRELHQSAPVKTKAPNAWGLYDMHGNVAEWCADWYTSKLNAGTDPVGPPRGNERVVRGGSWDSDAEDARSACRDEEEPDDRNSEVGFRFVI